MLPQQTGFVDSMPVMFTGAGMAHEGSQGRMPLIHALSDKFNGRNGSEA